MADEHEKRSGSRNKELRYIKRERNEREWEREKKALAFLHAYWFHQIALLLLGVCTDISYRCGTFSNTPEEHQTNETTRCALSLSLATIHCEENTSTLPKLWIRLMRRFTLPFCYFYFLFSLFLFASLFLFLFLLHWRQSALSNWRNSLTRNISRQYLHGVSKETKISRGPSVKWW